LFINVILARVFLSAIAVILTGSFCLAAQCFKYDSKGKRDPFVALVSKDGVCVSDAYGIKGIKDIRLEGIVWESEKPSIAIINGEIVEEEAEIGVVKVLKIDRDGVVFDVDGRNVKVGLVNE